MRPRWQRRLLGFFAAYPHVDLDNSGGDRRLWRGPFDRFDALSLGFIAAVFLILVFRVHSLRPFISDTWYHLAIAKQIAAQGSVPAWCTWDYAPVGRPQLYPPLIHVLIAGLSRLTGNVVSAGQVLAVLFLPASYLSCWFAARWLFDSRAAFAALVVLSLDVGHAIVELIYIPSCLVNILAPILLITFLTRRTWPSIILLSLMLYAHLGIPYLVAGGLVLFALKYPRYRPEALKVVGVALLWAVPWLVRVWLYRDWIGGVTHNLGLPMGLAKRLVSLQMFNLVLIGCGLWGIRHLRRWRAQEAFVRWMLIGILPLLFSYGGRYTMHAAPFFALSASTVIVKLLPAGADWRRAAVLLAATLLPTPALMPLTSTHILIMLAATGHPPMAQDKRQKTEAYEADCDQVAAWLKAHTSAEEVIGANKEWVGDMIPLLADRRSDFGAWWECSREVGRLQNRYLRDDGRRLVFVGIKPQSDVGSILGPTELMPGVDEKLDFSRLQIGLRHARAYSFRAVLDDFQTGESSWVISPSDKRSSLQVAEQPPLSLGEAPRRFLAWRVKAGHGGPPEISRRFSPGAATGLALNIRASAPLGGVRLGVTEADGSRYEWPLALPCAPAPVPLDERGLDRAYWLRVRVPLGLMTRADKSTDENRKLDLDQVTTLWLSAPKSLPREVEIDLDDIELMDVTVAGEVARATRAAGEGGGERR